MPERAGADLPALKILLVEDDDDDVVLFGALLGRAAPSSAFDHVADTEDVRARLKRAPYDLCFFDYHLGPVTGVELLRAVRADGCDLPIIMLTGQGDEALAVESMKAGASDYLAKSDLTPGLLGSAIRHATALYEAERRRRRVERALRESEARYRELVNRLPLIICELSREGETHFVNEAVTEITGWSADELIGHDWWTTLADVGAGLAELRARIASEDLSACELKMRHKNGRSITLEWNTARLRRNDDGDTVVCIGTDVTERVRMRNELMWLAVRDELTGLSNRRGFHALAEQQLKAAARDKRPMLAVFVDLDGLKSINDQLGHAEGDRALKDIAEVMRQTFRDSDVIGRLGGDEFVALVAEGAQFRGDGIIQRLQTAVAAFNATGSRPYYLSASIGVARYDPQSPIAIDGLVNHADSEMYEHKQRRERRDVVRKIPAPAG